MRVLLVRLRHLRSGKVDEISDEAVRRRGRRSPLRLDRTRKSSCVKTLLARAECAFLRIEIRVPGPGECSKLDYTPRYAILFPADAIVVRHGLAPSMNARAFYFGILRVTRRMWYLYWWINSNVARIEAFGSAAETSASDYSSVSYSDIVLAEATSVLYSTVPPLLVSQDSITPGHQSIREVNSAGREV